MASRNIMDCVPKLRDAIPQIIAEYEQEFPHRSLIVVCTARSVEEQWELFKRGRKFVDKNGKSLRDPLREGYAKGEVRVRSVSRARKVTSLDGVRKMSKHNTDDNNPFSRAVDFGVIIAGKYLAGYEDHYLYEPITALANKHGLVHGADFPKYTGGSFKDMPHVETQDPFFLK